ncbi:MAG TPA: M56 and DUF3738 domain-containing protein [Bryobacteraceae bacterium]|jgi:uncharacterized protein (TIGR03435 family)|nr:M56 and DUF3738 domain-containing protein [Bryobacteraceae bacterium]
MIPADLSPLANHLWQSTLFAAVAWLLTLTLRRNRAAVRYGLWLTASVKFLIPFSLLVSAGSQFGLTTTPAIAEAPFSIVVEQISQPFAAPARVVPMVTAAPSNPFPLMLFAVWLCGFVICAIMWLRSWRRFRAALRSATPLRLDLQIPVMTSPTRLEPGVIGIRKPILLLPQGIADRLTPAQLQSILAHELCHVCRRDNLTAAIHMLVESIFWFHPLVWWIGARLVDERERACDEEVVRSGSEPQVYAEGILNVCKFYLQSPLSCASGVTGADLKKRIEAIVNHRISLRLTLARKSLLAAAGMAALVGPVLVGILHVPQSRAQSKGEALTFEVASVKPSDPNVRRISMGYTPDGGLKAVNVTLKELIANAYNIVCGKFCDDERISGGPKWIYSDRFDVVTKGPQLPQPGRATREQIRQCVQALLADRFKLVIRRETREMQVYHLVVAKKGSRLKEYTGDDQNGGIGGNRPGQLIGERTSLYGLVANLTGMLGRPVIDRTGLTGRYDFKLEWTPEMLPDRKGPDGTGEKVGASAPGISDPSIFTALQEQLGLKLESQKGPVEVVIIERAEKPAAN